MKNSNRRKFEDELKDLEEIVTRIDSGELSLEESISAFERGVGLVRSLNQRLDEVERKVEVLIRGAEGELRTTPMEIEGLPEGLREEDERSGPGDDDDPPF